MKKSPLLMIALAVLLTSCGTVANLASSSGEARFQDGIYSSSPSFISKAEKDESQAKTDALVEETKASRIYLFGDRKDTVMIPENMSASIRYDKSLASTIVTVEENPYSWMNNIDPWYYYTPYSIGSAWYWSRHYDPWYSSAWRWNTWAYSPWRYYGWYDPFYIGGWYDPWYYGYAGIYGGWYDPWYHHHHHHHYHPDPVVHKEDRWYGSRHQTGSERIFTSGTSSRGGIATSSRTSRTSSASAAGRTSVTTSSSQRTTSGKVSTTPTRVSTSQKSTTYRRPAGTTNYRKPASGSTGSSTGRSAATYRNSTSETSRSSATYRSYNSGAGSGSTRSSYSTGGASRSSYSGGGSGYSGGGSGASRSSGSSGARR